MNGSKAWRYSFGDSLQAVDQRVIDHYGIQEVSLGDFVMSPTKLPHKR